MVIHSSFSNPLQHAFFHRKNSDKDDVTEMKSRKVSIDQIVLTREDSYTIYGMADMHFTSFEVEVVDQPARARTDAIIGDYGYPDRGTMAHSYSYPSFPAQNTAVSHQVPQHPHDQRLSQSFTGSGSSLQHSHPLPPPSGPPPNYYSRRTPRNYKGNMDPALQARVEAVKIQEQLLGVAHPDVIFALAGIAKLYEKLGEHAQAANIRKENQMRSMMAMSGSQGNLNRSSHEENEDQDVPIEISFPFPR